MAIASLDGLIAGMQAPKPIAKASSNNMTVGRANSAWGTAGTPGSGTYDTTLNGVILSSSSSLPAGAIPRTDPVSGNSYLARFEGQATTGGTLLLVDRLWHNGGYTITSITAQNSTTPTWPARDTSGTTNGDGVLIGLEISVTAGAGTPTLTISYTNQAGVSGRTGTNLFATGTTPVAGSFWIFSLQAGDTGVRSVESLTLSATWSSGTMNLVAFRLVASLELTAANTPNAIDALTAGMPRIYDGSVLQLIMLPSAGGAANIAGSYIEAQG